MGHALTATKRRICGFMRRKNTTSDRMKQYIVESFLILLEKNTYDEITIGEITEKAGVNRSTYYRHFGSKEDIIVEYYRTMLVSYMNTTSLPDAKAMERYLFDLFTIMMKHKKELLLIHQSGHSYLLLKVFNEHFTQKGTSDIHTMKSYYHSGGIFNCNLYWFEHEMNLSPKEMAVLAVQSFPLDYISLVLHE